MKAKDMEDKIKILEKKRTVFQIKAGELMEEILQLRDSLVSCKTCGEECTYKPQHEGQRDGECYECHYEKKYSLSRNEDRKEFIDGIISGGNFDKKELTSIKFELNGKTHNIYPDVNDDGETYLWVDKEE